jgi:hypothetical protein
LKKKIKYKIDLPVLVEDKKFTFLFKKRCTYTFINHRVRILNNCFITNSGLVLYRYLIPLNSAENLIGFEDKTFYFKHLRIGFEQNLVCKYGKSLKYLNLNDENLYFSVHTPWFGYFSWITTSLPRIFKVLNEFPNAVLIYPKEWDSISYVHESLILIPNLRIFKVKSDHHLFVKKYLLTPVRNWTSHFNKSDLNFIRSYFTNGFSILKRNPQLLYISRKKSKRRKVVNEYELENYLEKIGFTIICMEDYSFSEQINLVYNSKILISTHGAGLTNINFAQKDNILIELTPVLDNFKNFRYPFWRMSSHLGIKYYCLFCKKISYKLSMDEYDSDILVDLTKLEKIINNLRDNKIL